MRARVKVIVPDEYDAAWSAASGVGVVVQEFPEQRVFCVDLENVHILYDLRERLQFCATIEIEKGMISDRLPV